MHQATVAAAADVPDWLLLTALCSLAPVKLTIGNLCHAERTSNSARSSRVLFYHPEALPLSSSDLRRARSSLASSGNALFELKQRALSHVTDQLKEIQARGMEVPLPQGGIALAKVLLCQHVGDALEKNAVTGVYSGRLASSPAPCSFCLCPGLERHNPFRPIQLR